MPDIIGCYKGRFFGIECKAGKNKTTALQDREISLIHNAEGVAWVVNEENIDSVREALLSFEFCSGGRCFVGFGYSPIPQWTVGRCVLSFWPKTSTVHEYERGLHS